MRVRHEMYEGGRGTGCVAECDLSPKQARKRFYELKTIAKCGWCELVAEDDAEGEYMEIIDSHEQIKLAQMISTIC